MEIAQTIYDKTVDGVHILYRVVGADWIDLRVGTRHREPYGRCTWEEPGLVRFIGRLASFSRLMLFDKRGTGMSRSPAAESARWRRWSRGDMSVRGRPCCRCWTETWMPLFAQRAERR